MQTFIETGLRPEILESVEKLGFTQPTPIQSQTIPFLLNSEQDLIAMAQTGTGKTAAFGLPILHKLDTEMVGVQSIILCPTRELCLQITNDLKSFTLAMNISIVPVYGGAPIYEQISAIRKKCNIVVGTPGRVNDLVNRGKLNLSGIRFLVLDEADEMLKMGFKDEMDAILDQTPDSKQTLLFSATMPPDINRMAGKHMQNPHTISVSRQNTSNTDISHEYCVTSPPNTYQALRRIADINPDIYGIVFCRTRQETKDIADKLMGDGYNADALHGDLSQAQRDYVMGRFRNRNLQILVATDVAARGLDVDNLTHVIHYHLPDDPENYIHRSGRTGRAGRKGKSIAILAPAETRRLSFMEKQAGHKFIHTPIPNGKEVFEKRLINFMGEVSQSEPEGFDADQYLKSVEMMFEGLSKEEVIKKLIAHNFNRLHKDYQGTADLNVDTGRRARTTENRGARRSVGEKFAKYSINVGSKNDLRPDVLISIINRQTPDKKIAIGKIDIQKKVSFFEADSQHEKHLIKAFRRARYKGMSLMVQPMDVMPSKRSSGKRNGGKWKN
ncbi:DEAD/DEAH box helicase [Alkalitalea saponilacus]|uniref:RNA helicase n=1 Tax=Alkalitalea saponilacus TaxID=889453 RepID=A0A1T5HSR1_9BACT|nr:DEAD/DEAH box helicase [Alkalitalea saponilacus]ASB47722.1 DEAD/DEAH box helicase [Alkalitalea saponilacus]SKC23652.1 ATP-dependent RNA helicase DeaD [Alkalitalea saponilacus]